MKAVSFNNDWCYATGAGAGIFSMGQDAPTLTPVTLPHDASIHQKRTPDAVSGGAKGFYPDGVYHYVKKFEAPLEWKEKCVKLEFEGVYRNACVFLNGDFAGQWPNGYTNFVLDLNDLLKFGQENELKVTLYTDEDSRWYAGAGIYRNVNLYVSDPLHFAMDGIRLTTTSADSQVAAVAADITVENKGFTARDVMVVLDLVDEEQNIACHDFQKLHITGNAVEQLHPRLYVRNPKLWSLDDPHLYTVKATILEGETVIDQTDISTFGIRVLALDPVRGLTVNGQTVKLYGGCIHHDNGVIGSATIDRAEERRVQLLKSAGYNAIRSAHHPMGKALLEACDRYGVAVMDELGDMWYQSKRDKDYSHDFGFCWQEDARAMVKKDYNHPCVFMYSVGNEIPESGKQAGARLYRQIGGFIRSLDGTRYITAGLNNLVGNMDALTAIMNPAGASAEAAGVPAGVNAEAAGVSAGAGVEAAGVPAGAGAEAAGVPAGAETAAGVPAGAETAAGVPAGVSAEAVNAAMADPMGMMSKAAMHPAIIASTNEAYESLDICGYNYAADRYVYDEEHFSNWISVGAETFPKDLAYNWDLVMNHNSVVGDFVWTSWDYLGEAGIGKDNFKNSGFGFGGEYPWFIAYDADFDITGRRTPQGYYREIVVGHRTEPYAAIQDPDHYGDEPVVTGWSWPGTVSSWNWPGYEGKHMCVEVYGKGEEAQLIVNGEILGRKPIPRKSEGQEFAWRVVFDAVYYPGKLEAVILSGGQETGRYVIESAGDDIRLRANVDREVIRADDKDLAFLDIDLVDGKGRLNQGHKRTVTVHVEGAGILQGLGSACPAGEENFFDESYTTWYGHVLAVIRPCCTGTITVTVSADDCETKTVTIQAV